MIALPSAVPIAVPLAILASNVWVTRVTGLPAWTMGLPKSIQSVCNAQTTANENSWRLFEGGVSQTVLVHAAIFCNCLQLTSGRFAPASTGSQ
jgi:hypothetical protein